MSVTGIDAIKSLLGENVKPHRGRLVIDHGQLCYKDKKQVHCLLRFQAKLGFGNASLSKIAAFIDRDRRGLFAKGSQEEMTQTWKNLNQRIATYNQSRVCCWKRARRIRGVISTHIIGIDPKGPLTNTERFDLILHNFLDCKKAFSQLDKKAPEGLNKATLELASCFAHWQPTKKREDKQRYREEKHHLNRILNFKNIVRATCIDPGKKTLKGPPIKEKMLLNKDHQQQLKTNLKEIRRAILTKHNKTRLETDAALLAELHARLSEKNKNGPELDLIHLLQKMQKKNAEGKPLHLPKWFHCTQEIEALEDILVSCILYSQRRYFPGCFVSNLPEHSYGPYCVALSDYIEETGTKNFNSKTRVYPQYSQLHASEKYPIYYSNKRIAPKTRGFNNQQKGVGIWLGFQRGASTLNRKDKRGTEGIPLNCSLRIRSDKPLKYYKDTTVAFIFSKIRDQELSVLANKMRILYFTPEEAEAYRTLINATFMCTLPKAWKGKLKHSRRTER